MGHSIAAVAADTFGQAQAAVERIAIEWDVLEPLLDPDEAVRQESSSRTWPGTSAAISSAGSPRQTRWSRPSIGPRSCCTTRWRRIKPSVTGRTTGSRSTSRRSTSGASAPRWPQRSAFRPTRCASSVTRWAVASERRTVPATTRRLRPSSRRGPAGRSSARSRGVRRTSPQATATRRSRGCPPVRHRTGRSSRSAATSSTLLVIRAGPPPPRDR